MNEGVNEAEACKCDEGRCRDKLAGVGNSEAEWDRLSAHFILDGCNLHCNSMSKATKARSSYQSCHAQPLKRSID